MDGRRPFVAHDDEVHPQLRAVTFWTGLLGSLAIWVILATFCLRLF